MRRPSLCTWKTDFILFLTVEIHYRTSTRGTSILQHTAAWYGMLWSSTTVRTSFVIVLKISINKCQNHGIPAVQCTEIASHPISPCDWHLCSLSSSPSITGSDPWGHTLLSATVIQYEGLQSVTQPPWSSADLHHMSYYQYLIIISFQRSAFNLPSLVLFLCTSPYSLYSENFIFQIHFFTFKFISFIFTPCKILLLHSHLLTYKNPCILQYKNKKSPQFSSPIGFRLILHLHFSISDYLISVHVSKVIFQPYEWLYGHLAPLHIVLWQLRYTRTSDMVSSSTSFPWFLALFFNTLCAASIWPHCSLSRPGFGNPFALATAPQCEASHCTVCTQHLV